MIVSPGDSPVLTFTDVETVDLAGYFSVWVTSPEAGFLRGKFLWANWDVDELKARKDELQDPKMLVTGLLGWV